MRLYVQCHDCSERIYLSTRARKRSELPNHMEITCPHCGYTDFYSRDEVHAEAETGVTIGGAVLGGLIGLLGGPLGVIIGGIGGSILGANADAEEQRRVREFYE